MVVAAELPSVNILTPLLLVASNIAEGVDSKQKPLYLTGKKFSLYIYQGMFLCEENFGFGDL